MPAKILKENSDIFSVTMQNFFNACLSSGLSKGTFPKELKPGDISLLFKKEDVFMKKNYRQITVLPLVSKVFEKLVDDPMLPSIQSFLSSLLREFRGSYSTQHSLHAV